ncbi:MAG: DUF3552 domain-containing protein [Myxococcales bacterium]|nr:DUF3552 domain-containing protein [Myxococcales bacterium]
MISWIVIAAAAAVGAGIGIASGRARAMRERAEAEALARRLRDEAQRAAKLALREAEAKGREARDAVLAAAEDDESELDSTMTELNAAIDQGEVELEERRAQLDAEQATLDGRFAEVRRAKQEAQALRKEAKTIGENTRPVLEERSGESGDTLIAAMVERLVDETRSQCADRLRNLESAGADDFARQAKRVMGIVMQRYTGHCVRERTSTTMPLPKGAAEKLQGEAAEHVAKLSEITNVPITFAEDGSSARLESGDGVARELCRRALTRFHSESNIRDTEALITSLSRELERDIGKLGRKAFNKLSLQKAADEIVELVGKLNYRTSYTQNQWRHAIEAAQLASMMAEELGLDPVIARRGTLMHDIGKALTHEMDGSHALIGGEIARRSGEDERVSNAIAAHHGEEPSISAYAPLVAAADAMSGGRPGARREMVESYGDRIGDLERIAHSFNGVESVHAVQAGRELRIHVDQRRVKDADLEELSTAIAERISDEMTFPGQIRVTVIREFVASEVAN